MKKFIINRECENKGKIYIEKTTYYLEDHITNPMEAFKKSFTDFMISAKGQKLINNTGPTLTWNSIIDILPTNILANNGIHILNDNEISCSVNGGDVLFEEIQKKYL